MKLCFSYHDQFPEISCPPKSFQDQAFLCISVILQEMQILSMSCAVHCLICSKLLPKYCIHLGCTLYYPCPVLCTV